MATFTPTQGRYLAYIKAYLDLHGYPPAEAEIAAALCVSAPSVNQMVKTLVKKGLILRHPGKPRSLELLAPEDEIPPWGDKPSGRRARAQAPPGRKSPPPQSPPGRLYVLHVALASGPISAKYAHKEISREIEIRGDQTLADLHDAIFRAFDRWDEHLYEFQFGKRPFDSQGPRYGGFAEANEDLHLGDARQTKLDDLKLRTGRIFGYWFDFGDDWYHHIQVMRIAEAIPTVTYPRITKRVGKSPPQYPDEE
jgi:hypothetical protein